MRSTVVTEQDVQRDIREILKDQARPRSLLVAYTLWLLLFWAGAHRFYLGRPRSAVMMLACSVVTLGVGGLVWACVDAFLIPGMLNRRNVRFIEPRWMRVQPLGDVAPAPAAPMPVARSVIVSPLHDLEEVAAAGDPLDRLPAMPGAERHLAYPSSPPFLRRPTAGRSSWAAA